MLPQISMKLLPGIDVVDEPLLFSNFREQPAAHAARQDAQHDLLDRKICVRRAHAGKADADVLLFEILMAVDRGRLERKGA